jgi:predicted Zn-ribbon and HTH transcriptional regulator
MKATDAETVEKIQQWRKEGMTAADIAAEVGCTERTVFNVLRTYAAKRPKKPEEVRRALAAMAKPKRCTRCGEPRRVFMVISRLCPECDVLDAVRRGVIVCEGGNDGLADGPA